MKIRSTLATLIAFAMTLIPLSLAAGDFSITRYTIGGGGGISTMEEGTVTGTIGQAEVGVTSTGGGFELTGGFWTTLRSTEADESTDVWVVF